MPDVLSAVALKEAGATNGAKAEAPEKRRRANRTLVTAMCVVTLSLAATVFAQTPSRPDPEVVPIAENTTRGEAWSFFEPPPGGGEADYQFLGNRATLGVRVNSRRIAFQSSFQYAQLIGLPRESFGPGPLGPGPLFFAAAHNPEVFQLYIKSMSLTLKDIPAGVSLEVGRMAYASGKGTLFTGRLVGNVEWTMFERAFDGVRVDVERASWRAHASFVMPTQGAYEESANPTMRQVQIATVGWTRRSMQVFAHDYRDTRSVESRPDNTASRAAAADIHVQTLGASWGRTGLDQHRRPSSATQGADDPEGEAGGAEVLLWGAVQVGQWYEAQHRALSVGGDVGYRWPRVRWRPFVSGGALYASGDDSPSDGRHETFFPMVPTTRPGVLGGTYAQMNLRDLYARVGVHPRPAFALGAEVHGLSLATPADHWYSGTGATSSRGGYFGYSMRASQSATGLGTYLQLVAQSPLNRYWTVRASAGLVRGGDVVRRQFAGHWLRVLVIESALAMR